MRNMIMLVLAAVLSCIVVAAQAPVTKETGKETKSGMKPGKKETKAKLNKCSGVVESIDLATGRLTINDQKKMTMTMTVGAGARIFKDGKPAALSAIMVGEKVHIMYEGDMADPVIKEVRIAGKGAMKKEKPEKKEAPRSGM